MRKSERLLQTLMGLLNTRDEDTGICGNVEFSLTPILDVIMYAVIRDWHHYSGTPQYPVSHPDMGPAQAYGEAPKWEGEYGNRRKQLLYRLISELEARIEAVEEVNQLVLNPDLIKRTKGICGNIPWILHSEFRKFARIWDKYSGNPNFPVPKTKLGFIKQNPERAFYATHDMWAGQYGRDRLDLLTKFNQHLQEME